MRGNRSAGQKHLIFNLTAPITTPVTIESLLSATQLGYFAGFNQISAFIRPGDTHAVDMVDSETATQEFTFPISQTSELPLTHILSVKVKAIGATPAPFQLMVIGA